MARLAGLVEQHAAAGHRRSVAGERISEWSRRILGRACRSGYRCRKREEHRQESAASHVVSVSRTRQYRKCRVRGKRNVPFARLRNIIAGSFMTHKYNVAVIGYGWAATAHIAAINATPQAQVTAVWSSVRSIRPN